MVGMHIASHLARRAVAASQDNQFEIEQLKRVARLYEDTPDAAILPFEVLPIFITGVIFMVLFVSVSGNIRHVIV